MNKDFQLFLTELADLLNKHDVELDMEQTDTGTLLRLTQLAEPEVSRVQSQIEFAHQNLTDWDIKATIGLHETK